MHNTPPRHVRPMATKAAEPAPPRSTRHWKWLLLLGLLVAAFVVLDRWRELAPHPIQASIINAPASDAPAGRNTPQPRTNVGIIPGHNRLRRLPTGEVARMLDPDPVTGLPPDLGAVCRDGTSEADITWNVAQRVANELKRDGRLTAELLSEFDPQRARDKFFGLALISIHVDACLKDFSGFKVAHIAESSLPEVEDALVDCLRDQYKAATGLLEHVNTITPDMQYYHAFREITPTTPGAIIELGFLNDDKDLLKQGDLPVKGLLDGIRCFLTKR